MKKILFILLLGFGSYTLSSFGYIDNPRAISLSNSNTLKVNSRSYLAKKTSIKGDLLIDNEAINEGLDYKKLSFFQKVFGAISFCFKHFLAFIK